MASRPWSFLSSHGLVFVHVLRYPERTNREIAQAIGLTERTVYHILRDLGNEGYLVKKRIGRRTFYRVTSEVTLRHPSLRDIQMTEILELLSKPSRLVP